MIIDRVWSQQEGTYGAICTKSGAGKWEEHFIHRKDFKNLHRLIDKHKDKDIYFCPHLFTRTERKKQYAVTPKMLWADLDEVDPRKCAIKPTIAIESSPGRYVGLWMVDRKIEEDINRRLTYHLDADHGGWDLTQVLRVPGTTNYKYSSTPKVRLMYDDGPTYKLKDIIAKLPEQETVEDMNASEIFDKYQKMLEPWLRRELMTQKAPAPGKRSEMLWKIEHALLEAGLSKEETFALIKASVWNKFKGRRSEEEQLKRELDKVVGDRMKGGASKITIKHKYLARSMAEIETVDIDWIWYPILARGEITIIEGDPDLGKSYLTQMIGKAICDGEKLPSFGVNGHSTLAKSGKVAYFDMENSADTVTKKRLMSNGLKNVQNFYQEEEPFSWADTDRMVQVMDSIERLRPDLVVFDTMNTYLGGHVDTGRANSSQEAMFPLREIATRYDCAVVVIRHLVKAKKDKSALHAGQGSIAFAGFVRMVATVGRLPDDNDVRAFAVTKCNLAPKPKQVLTYEIVKLPDNDQGRDRSRFKWGELVSGVDADDIIKPGEKNTDRAEAEEWLREELSEGAIEAKKLEVMGERRGYSRRTLYRVAESIGVVKETKGFGRAKATTWSL